MMAPLFGESAYLVGLLPPKAACHLANTNRLNIEIAPNLFIEQSASPDQRRLLRNEYEAATGMIEAGYGPQRSLATLAACVSWECWVRFGGKRPGLGDRIPKGMTYADHWIRLSPRGQNRVFLLHELSHAELHRRIGAWASWRRLPAWFDEGSAVMVSNDPRYTETAWHDATGEWRGAARGSTGSI